MLVSSDTSWLAPDWSSAPAVVVTITLPGATAHAHLGRAERGAHALRVRRHVERLDRRVHRCREAHEVQRPRLHRQESGGWGRGEWGRSGRRRRRGRAVIAAAHERGRSRLGRSAPSPRSTYRFCGSQVVLKRLLDDRVAIGALQAEVPRLREAQGGADALEARAGPRESWRWAQSSTRRRTAAAAMAPRAVAAMEARAACSGARRCTRGTRSSSGRPRTRFEHAARAWPRARRRRCTCSSAARGTP